MNISLKPHILISHFIPGFVFIVISFCSFFNWKINLIVANLNSAPINNVVIVGFVSIIIAFLIGEVFDSSRDLLESLFDRILSKVNWDFFYKANKENIKKLHENYFTWYVFNLNSSLSLFGSLLFATSIINKSLPCKIWIIVPTSALILLIDGLILRKEIAKHTNEKEIITPAP